MSLQWIGQDDFAAGTLVGVAQDQQVAVGVEWAINALFDDDGDVVRRGAVSRLGAGAAAAGLLFMWSGYLGVNYVEIVATSARMYAVIADVFVDLGPPGVIEPCLPAIVADTIFLPSGFVWGGSAKAAYATGTITQAAGSPLITGAGTAWVGNVEPGMLYRATGGSRTYTVKSVDSATQITLTENAGNSHAAGTGYAISSVRTDGLPASNRTRHLAVVANRLLVATDNTIAFTPSNQPFTFNPTDFHKLPDGVVVQGIAGLKDQALVFTNYGLWTISNMSFDLTDDFGNPQQTLSRLLPEISLLHEAGLAEWSGTIIAPCVDRALLLDGVSPPVSLSDSIASLYMEQVRAGNRPGGGKVFRNHYFLPFLSPTKTPTALFVCRLNRPVKERQVYYPWAQWDGYPTKATTFDVDLRTTPVLRGAGADGWRQNLTVAFPPFTGEDPIADADGKPPIFDVCTRDFPPANGAPGHVRRLRLRYYTLGIGKIGAAYSLGDKVQRYRDVTQTGMTYAQAKANYPTYDAMLRGAATDPAAAVWNAGGARFWNVLGDQDARSPGVEPLEWQFGLAERPRWIRARFRSTDGIAQIKIRALRFAARPTSQTR